MSLAHALIGLVILRQRTSLAWALTCLAASSSHRSLAHGTTDAPAAQSLRDRPYAARLCRRGAACEAEGTTVFRGMSNNHMHRSAGSQLLVVC